MNEPVLAQPVWKMAAVTLAGLVGSLVIAWLTLSQTFATKAEMQEKLGHLERDVDAISERQRIGATSIATLEAQNREQSAQIAEIKAEIKALRDKLKEHEHVNRENR